MEHEEYNLLKPKITKILERWSEVENEVADASHSKDHVKRKRVMQEYNLLTELKYTDNEFQKTFQSIRDTRELIESSDKEMATLAQEECDHLEQTLKTLLIKLKTLVIPISPIDAKSLIMEIRAGTGGEEAALFAADLFRMYYKFAESQKWKVEIINANENDIGGYKEIIFSISGTSYSILKFESGVHRVQRIPTTESGGRIHTSAVTVAVLPEIEETEIKINSEDLRIDVFRSSGPGGQSVNTTDSAVRITHIPTGLVVSCQDEKSQHKNKAKAMRILRARLVVVEEERKKSERAAERKTQIGSGDRSERIRTYNFPQNRVSDHRIQLTLYQLDKILEGNLLELLNAVRIGLND